MFIIAIVLGGLALAALAAGLLRPKTDAYKDASPSRKISTLASPSWVSWRSPFWP